MPGFAKWVRLLDENKLKEIVGNLPSQNLCKAFKEGWRRRGYKMIDLDNWFYCGGDGGRNECDLAYFMQHFPLSRKPRHENMCICTQIIKNHD